MMFSWGTPLSEGAQFALKSWPAGPRTFAEARGDFGAFGKVQTLAWKAADPDGDSLIYSVEYSTDGKEWLSLAAMLRKPETSVDVAALPGLQTGMLRVRASDGVNTTVATVTAVRGGEEEAGDHPALENGTIADPTHFRWRIDGQEAGDGRWLVLSNRVKAGKRTVTVSVSDSDTDVTTASSDFAR